MHYRRQGVKSVTTNLDKPAELPHLYGVSGGPKGNVGERTQYEAAPSLNSVK